MSILTITIPTYNRSNYLKECLKSLNEALPMNYKGYVDILIIDNNSTDDTELIVMEAKNNIDIRYIKNHINIGPDENFKKCIEQANSKYVWIFGDDDIFFKDSIEYILAIIKNNTDIGLIHLSSKNFQYESELKNYKSDTFIYESIRSKEIFIKKVHTNITFISANIVNKDLLKDIDFNDIPNNNLGQVYWGMVSVIKAKQNIFCKNEVFAGRQFNSGNYEFCNVFGKNFIEILELIHYEYNVESLVDIFKNRLLKFYYPANIVRIRNSLSEVKYSNNCFKILYNEFKFNIYFWICTVPAMLLPKKIALYFLNIVEKIRSNR